MRDFVAMLSADEECGIDESLEVGVGWGGVEIPEVEVGAFGAGFANCGQEKSPDLDEDRLSRVRRIAEFEPESVVPRDRLTRRAEGVGVKSHAIDWRRFRI